MAKKPTAKKAPAKKKAAKKPETVDRYLIAVMAESGQRLDRVESVEPFDEPAFLKAYRKQAPDWLAEQAAKAEIVAR